MKWWKCVVMCGRGSRFGNEKFVQRKSSYAGMIWLNVDNCSKLNEK